MEKAIGELKASKKVYCSVCGQSHKRIAREKVFSSSEDYLKKAKASISTKINKVYTCRVCKSILKGE